MNVLVTGGCGFIGSNLIHQIIDFPQIKKLINLDCLTYAGLMNNISNVADNKKYTFQKGNICDKQFLMELFTEHSITHVMHLAAESHVDRSIENPGDFIQTNIVGTYNLLEACRLSWHSHENQNRLLHVSTDEVFGSLGSSGYFHESTPYAPNSPYSASKASSDMLVRAYFHTYNLPVVITNCSNNYGPYQYLEKLIPLVINKIINRQSIPVYGDGKNIRDWLYVDDHISGLWLSLTAGVIGESYNIGGNNEWENIQIVELICDILDEVHPSVCSNSRELITFVKDRLGHDYRYAIDSNKIRSDLGWKPKSDFQEGIRKTIKWYLNNESWMKEIFETKN